VNRISRPTCQRWAVILVSAAVLALGGCGRKGPLDLPPTASSQGAPAAAQGDTEAERAAQPGAFNPSSGAGADASPTAPKGRKKAFVLDPLLD
jgi:predicted small lipoprotein YifL